MENANPLILPIINTSYDFKQLGLGALYFKPDGQLYKKRSNGAEQKVRKIANSNPMVMELTNQELTPMAYGDLVVLDTVNPESVKYTNIFFGSGLIGVVRIGGASMQKVTVQFGGVIDVQMDDAAVAIGSYIIASSTFGKATSYFTEFIGVNGRALTSKPFGAGTVKVLLSGGIPEIF